MARTSLEKFDEEDPDYYMCKSCRTHIALAEDFNSIDAGTELTGAMFDKAVNLRVDGPVHHRQVAGKTVADIYCLNCDEKLGWIYIHLNGEHIAYGNDKVRLRMKKLVRRCSNQILDAETMSPTLHFSILEEENPRCRDCVFKFELRSYIRNSFQMKLSSSENTHLVQEFGFRVCLEYQQMEGIPLVNFDEYYMCKSCRTHIALEADLICTHLDAKGLCGGLFNKAVNVRVEEPAKHYKVHANTIADVYCLKCDDHLGWKYVEVVGEKISDKKEHIELGVDQILLQNENVKLIQQKLLKKRSNQNLDAELDRQKLLKKRSHENLDAETMSPVDENP
ncbi:UNVERIFIED_CONTAM: hypothetical protein Scaly_0375600 [Sesamum calycinum]|uniref:Yippee domain-containing protein n=1 Tax=Sesamum calycinum TaxID=2727403 RepID=A0AAW2SCA7_9LAMI